MSAVLFAPPEPRPVLRIITELDQFGKILSSTSEPISVTGQTAVSPTPIAAVISDERLRRIEAGPLHIDYRGLDLRKVLTGDYVAAEIAALQRLGVEHAPEHVLRWGPKRVHQVRVWAEKKHALNAVKDLPALINKTLNKTGQTKAA